MRLDKYLTQSGLGTRKKVHGFIASGEITVNDSPANSAMQEVDEQADQVLHHGSPVHYQGRRYYVFHKPKGCICARTDPRHRTVMDYFPEEERESLFIVGRLDKDTEGLLLLTNDGVFDQKLMHPDHHVKKTYAFTAQGQLTNEDIQKLTSGVTLEEGELPTKPAILENIVNHPMTEQAGCGQKWNATGSVTGTLIIQEGRNHQVRRMLKAVGVYVTELKRTAIGDLKLEESLKVGEYRSMTEEEILRCIGLTFCK